MTRFITFVVIFILPLHCFAVREIVFRKQTTVYTDKSKDSEVLTVFEKGEHTPISNKSYGDWRKIVVDVDGKPTVGWVLAQDLKDAKLLERKDPFYKDVYHLNKMGFGVLGAFSYAAQGQRTVNPSDGSAPADITSMGGTSLFFGALVDYPFSETFVLRGEILFRKMYRTGAGSFQGGSAANIQLDQSYLSGAVTAKFYLDSESNFWYGPGVEVAKLTTNRLVYVVNVTGGEQVTTDGISLPTFILVSGAFGYDIHLTKKFFILPAARLGIMVNANPIAFVFDVLVPITYSF